MGKEGVTHIMTTIVTHEREKTKRNMIKPLPSLTKSHNIEIRHQVVTLSIIPRLKGQVPPNILSV